MGHCARAGVSWILAFAAVAHSDEPLPRSHPAAQGFSAVRLRTADQFVAGSVGAGHYLGAVTLIVRHGAIVSWQAHGRRELGSSQTLPADAIFRIYSMTKPISSVAALMLMEHGKYRLDDPIGKYLPEMQDLRVFVGGTADEPQLRRPARPITVRDLFIHSAGFAAGGEDPPVAVALLNRANLEQSRDLRSYVAKLSTLPLATDPGTRFNYDGVQTVVLSRLIEVWSGEPFDRFLQERLFGPLRMHDTAFVVPKDQRHRIAQMTSTDATGRLSASPVHAGAVAGEPLNPYPSGAGGLYSTAADYARFCQMLLNGGELEDVSVLSDATVDMMMSNQLVHLHPPQTEFRPGEGFGLGGYVVVDDARRGRLGSVGQFGWFGAAGTYFVIDRKEQLVALLMLQHLPGGLPHDPPKLSAPFYNLVHRSLIR
jgi:CubicO group peptidase (beta-lactamase class C family)